MGFSHPVEFEQPEGITFEVPNPNAILYQRYRQAEGRPSSGKRTEVRTAGALAKGKGIRYKNEYVRRKEGKTGM